MTVSLKNRVGIIVVTYNNERDLPPLADSLSRAIHKEYVKKIVFVDPGSQDQTLCLISSLFPEAAVIQLDNKGYGAALNTGIVYFKKDLPHFFFFLNADIEIPPHCFNNLLDEFIKNDLPSFPIGIMGPRILAPTPRGWARRKFKEKIVMGDPSRQAQKRLLLLRSFHPRSLPARKARSDRKSGEF
ncbi:glycosyltransferase [Candidatus Methylacidiphilum infernorum]|uniref:Predicted glycosyltransferase n=1 Tax=Methylacidiphilum infernorum (isolate V4) TaxID=481448 RepID=B3DZK4_METI4|nr:glycosyltransferase [Candidatus Methylacidiphilum infernorum]ACD82621.1 Predicted glycosyltransferase [Methylacidiphilum infernorum V4]